MTSHPRTCALVMGMVALAAAPAPRAGAQDARPAGAPLLPSPGAADAADDDGNRARLLGLLMFRTVTLRFDHTPAREAMASLRRAARIPIIARWRDDAVGFGLEPSQPITYEAQATPVLDVLEAILAQCAATDACTWQLRRGYVEAGTKERLSVPAARDLRLYDIRDLMIEAPNFGGGASHDRQQPLGVAVKIVTEVCETIEPGRWDFGQEIQPPDDDRMEPRPVQADGMHKGTDASGPADAAPRPSDTQPDRSASEPATSQPAGGAAAGPHHLLPRSRSGVPIWAEIRVWRDRLIVIAPDFIHREIGGYTKPIPPDDADSDASHRGKP